MRRLLCAAPTPTPTLVYLPITFCGSTALSPAMSEDGAIPDDASVMEVYHQSLRETQGHSLDTDKLVSLG